MSSWNCLEKYIKFEVFVKGLRLLNVSEFLTCGARWDAFVIYKFSNPWNSRLDFWRLKLQVFKAPNKLSFFLFWDFFFLLLFELLIPFFLLLPELPFLNFLRIVGNVPSGLVRVVKNRFFATAVAEGLQDLLFVNFYKNLRKLAPWAQNKFFNELVKNLLKLLGLELPIQSGLLLPRLLLEVMLGSCAQLMPKELKGVVSRHSQGRRHLG